jgi:hypothetical protein
MAELAVGLKTTVMTNINGKVSECVITLNALLALKDAYS